MYVYANKDFSFTCIYKLNKCNLKNIQLQICVPFVSTLDGCVPPNLTAEALAAVLSGEAVLVAVSTKYICKLNNVCQFKRFTSPLIHN